MVLARWEPFRELRRMENTMDRMWRGFGVGRGFEGWAVPLDVVQDGDDIVVRASIPGIEPGDIELTIEEGVLTIKGATSGQRQESDGQFLMRERRAGKFYRSLRLPDSLDAENVTSQYENGVLTVTIPKLEAKKAKRLEIKVGK